MNSESDRYSDFLAQLRRLSFCTVRKVLKRREDLFAFRAKDGRWTTDKDPWFGDAYASLTEEERMHAELQYRYYCGHADDVFYRKSGRTTRRMCLLPALSLLLSRQTLPIIGEIIFGHVEEDGPEGRRFIWWNFATKQDRNFTNLLLGRATFSNENLEKKLVLRDPASPNWNLYLLAKALHFRDVGYFVEQIQKHGERPLELNLDCSLDEWLSRHTAVLLPEFYKEFKASLHQ